MPPRREQTGFTLIELLIVVAIIGVIAAIAIPNLMNAMDRTRQKSTMANMRSISNAVSQYSVDENRFPQTSGDVEGNLDTHLETVYIKRCPDDDGWGFPLQYASDGSEFTLRSYGKDGKPDALANGGIGGTTKSYNADIVLVDGTFVQWPEGQQAE